jgi:hypothetical protein
MRSLFQEAKQERSRNAPIEDLKYPTNGTNFSYNPTVPRELQVKSIPDIKHELKRANPECDIGSQTNHQIAEFLRNEKIGILNISKIAMKTTNHRDPTEKQFFVMFLKLRVPFFKEFDKRTLRFVMDRSVTTTCLRSQVVAEYKSNMNKMHVVLEGRLGRYDGHRSRSDQKEISHIFEEGAVLGEEGMTDPVTWKSCVLAETKSVLLTLGKRDLIEMLQTAKVFETNNR